MFEPLQKSSSGYQLIDLGKNMWQIRTPKGRFTGSLRKVYKYAVKRLGFSTRELDIGIEIMRKELYNGAEYGMFKGFMYPVDVSIENERFH